MTTKEAFLQTVREALGDTAEKPALPPVPEVWPVQGLSREELIRRFERSLRDVAGEFFQASDLPAATEFLVALLRKAGARRIGLLDRPLVDALRPELERCQEEPPLKFFTAPPDPATIHPSELARLDASIIAPEFLIADTGSCLFAAPSLFDRLMIYLPPLCIVLASRSMLREHLPHLWNDFEAVWQAGTSGEYVIVTGPSRTADIEKILILGVHGPRRFVVVLLP